MNIFSLKMLFLFGLLYVYNKEVTCNMYTLPATRTPYLQHVHLTCNMYTLLATCTPCLQHVHLSCKMYTLPSTCTSYLQHVNLTCNMYTITKKVVTQSTKSQMIQNGVCQTIKDYTCTLPNMYLEQIFVNILY